MLSHTEYLMDAISASRNSSTSGQTNGSRQASGTSDPPIPGSTKSTTSGKISDLFSLLSSLEDQMTEVRGKVEKNERLAEETLRQAKDLQKRQRSSEEKLRSLEAKVIAMEEEFEEYEKRTALEFAEIQKDSQACEWQIAVMYQDLAGMR